MSDRAALDTLAAELERVRAERDNLDENLARVQRHLQFAVGQGQMVQNRLDRATKALRRLGSTEGFIGAISVDPSNILWVELAARGEFAITVLTEIEQSA